MIRCISIRQREISAQEEDERIQVEAEADAAHDVDEEDSEELGGEVRYAMWNALDKKGVYTEERVDKRHNGTKKGMLTTEQEDCLGSGFGDAYTTELSTDSVRKKKKEGRRVVTGTTNSPTNPNTKYNNTTAGAMSASAETLQQRETVQSISTHPRNKKSSKVLSKVKAIDEVLDITQLAKYHSQKPNKILLRRLSSIQQDEELLK